MSYLYVNNVSPQDRFDQIAIEADNGSMITLRKGHSYSLSANELSRARQFIYIIDSDLAPDSADSAVISGSGGGVIVTPPGSTAPSISSYKVWVERLV